MKKNVSVGSTTGSCEANLNSVFNVCGQDKLRMTSRTSNKSELKQKWDRFLFFPAEANDFISFYLREMLLLRVFMLASSLFLYCSFQENMTGSDIIRLTL